MLNGFSQAFPRTLKKYPAAIKPSGAYQSLLAYGLCLIYKNTEAVNNLNYRTTLFLFQAFFPSAFPFDLLIKD